MLATAGGRRWIFNRPRQIEPAMHVSVLYQEVLTLLAPRPGGLYVDGTLGAGGHSEGLLKASAPDGRVLGLDRDHEALQRTQARLADYGARLVSVAANFADMATVAPAHGFTAVDGVVLDLGLSSDQLDSPTRGFSFRGDAPLDMRFDVTQGPTAADLVNSLPEAELADVLWRYGEVAHSRRLARALVARRPITTTAQLVEVALQHSPQRVRGRLHPATQLFQALRMAVNQELAALEQGLVGALQLLKPGGRLAVISFHSLEDRMVKQFLRQQSGVCRCPPRQPICTCGRPAVLKLLTRKAVKATTEEIARNPRSRSARLRAAEKLFGT